MRTRRLSALVAVGFIATLGLAGCGDDGKSSPDAAQQPEIKLGQTGATPAPSKRRAVKSHPVPEPKPARKAGPPRPPITQRLIPFDQERVQQTIAYTRRHYGEEVTTLDPKVIVEHFTVTPTADGVVSLFSQNKPDVELHELPGVCSHFLIDRDGTIFQLVPIRQICRHTVGLNDVAIGIEHVGASDAEVMNDSAQLKSSLALTAWLRCRYGIGVSDVIGHAESLSSSYHHENVASLKRQTHHDFQPPAMNRYRAKLEGRKC
jgi:N-acetylmuramoyl-L-alanine amidase-like protein